MATSTAELGEDIRKGLEDLSTCEISDALVKLGNVTGGFIPNLNIYSPSGREEEDVKVVGRVFTVRLVEQERPDQEHSNGSKAEQHFVDAAPSGSVILISPDFVSGAACWGGLMSTAAKAKGIKGVVVLGGCRDFKEHREIGFPVFAQFHSTLGQKTFLRPSEYNASLEIPILPPPHHIQIPHSEPIRKTRVDPGDILVGDIDGVVAIPFHQVEEVIRVAQKGREVDENVKKDLEVGKGVKESMKKWRGS
ncbi:hypothetical protein I203_104215 [Kwoniella mangroviensis CBS 8507]|uniref:uncharacterized protein n=1 Tax=Kwoniella mangroviensis CBS 8507 TaxID=1296122 RepID=UPI00080CE0AE|nr:uncharacterized protein I203_00839 [Kwoniella mangroviensis CBS 8507]OCF70704.1 hypothetical protein I203_00839 [Kwoniella mangroviensis CBS 8507]